MANPTSNFGWQMPTATDLVTDLPADFEVFGQAVDTDFVDLLGGTTGQILSKTSATDLDFTWINNDQGDITGVTAGNGISVTDPTGPVPTVAINTAVTADLTTAQTLTNKKLSDSTTTIVDSTDATKAIKFDVAGTTNITGTIATAFTTAKTVTIPDTTGTVALTNGVINNTLTTTTGDIIYASAANTPARLGIGSSAQVLSVSGGIPAWTTPAGGKVLQVVSANCTTDTTIASTTYTTTTITASITPTLNTSKILVMYSGYVRLSVSTTSAVELGLKLLRDATVVADMSQGTNARALEINVAGSSSGMAIALPLNYNYLDSPATTSSTTYTLQAALMSTAAGRSMRWQIQNIPSVITLLEIGA